MAIKHAEDAEQIKLMDWCRYKVLKKTGVNLFVALVHIKNESAEKGSKIQIAARINRQKKMGFKSGTPDLLLAYPAGGYPGLFIEMKRCDRSKARLSQYQKARIEVHRKLGYRVEVCYGFEEAKTVLENYLVGEI